MLKQASIAAMTLAVLSMMVAGAQTNDATKYPDWSGQWNRVPDGGVPRYDPTKPIRKQEAPIKPDYQVRHEASMRDQDVGGHELDTAYTCRPPGMPRMMSGVALMEFLISADVTRILFDRNDYAPRRIYTDNRPWPKFNEDNATFPGHTIGRWVDTDGDGRYDTLEAETRHVKGPRTWDQSGMPMADDHEGVVKERLFLSKEKPDLLHNEITTTDNSLTRPWTVMKNYRRVLTGQKMVWAENNCIEGQNHVTIGKEAYFLSADGTIMPMRKGQPAPDLKYFDQAQR